VRALLSAHHRAGALLRTIEAQESLIENLKIDLSRRVVDREAYNQLVQELNDALPAEAAGMNRIEYVRQLVKQRGMKPMSEY
jgi:hypothetical protein